WSVAALVPITLSALVEIVKTWPRTAGTAQSSITYFPIVISAIVVGLLTSIGTEVTHYATNHFVRENAKDLAVDTWGGLSHVAVAVGIVSLLNLVFTIASKTAFPRIMRIGTVMVAAGLGCGITVEEFLSTAFSFSGWLSILYASLMTAMSLLSACALVLRWK